MTLPSTLTPALARLLLALAVSSLAPPASAGQSPPDRYRVGWEGSVPREWETLQTQAVSVTVRNQSPTVWLDPKHSHPSQTGHNAIRLTYCWRPSSAAHCRQDRADLAAPLPPGDAAPLTIVVRAPEEPGRYVLEMELVEEFVAYFRDAGGATLATETIVRPLGGRPTPREHVLAVAGLVLLAVAVFFFCGFGVTTLLPGGRTSAASPFLMPFVGFGALALVGHALALLRPGTDTTFAGILVAFGAVNFVAWSRGGRLRLSRRHLGGWAAALFAVVLAAYPLVRVGFLTSLGGEIDATIYVSRASWMQQHGLYVWPERLTTDFVRVASHDNLAAGLRQGDQYALAFVSSVAGLRPHQLFSIFMAVFYGLMPLGAYTFARFGCRMRQGASTLAAFLTALQPILNYVVMDSFFSQAASLGMYAATAYVLARVFRARGLRSIPLAALMVAALSTFYSVYAVLVMPLAGVGVALRLLRPREGWTDALASLAGRGLLLAALTLVLCPVGWWLTLRGLATIQQVSALHDRGAQGNTAVYPPLGEVVGLVSRAAINHELALPQPPAAYVALVLALVLVLSALGLRSLRGPGRLLAAATLAFLVAVAVYMRFLIADRRGFPYGYFKIVSLASPFLLTAFAQGVAWAVRRGRAMGGPAGVSLAAVAAATALAVGGTAFHHLRAATPNLAYGRLSVDWDAIRLQTVRTLIPYDEPLLVEDPTWPGRSWDLYLLYHGNQYDRGPVHWQAAPRESESRRMIRRALFVGNVGYDPPRAGEPWFDPERHEVLWSAGRFRLLVRRDGAIADIRVAVPLSGADARPVRIVPGEGTLTTESSAGRATQEIERCASGLDVWFDARTAGSVRITQPGRTWTEAVPAGAHAVRVPVLETEVAPLSGELTLERVQAR